MATIARIMHGDRAIFVHYNDSPNNMLPVLNELLARDGEEQVVRKLFAHRWWGYLATSGFHSLACDKLTVCINGYGGGRTATPRTSRFFITATASRVGRLCASCRLRTRQQSGYNRLAAQ